MPFLAIFRKILVKYPFPLKWVRESTILKREMVRMGKYLRVLENITKLCGLKRAKNVFFSMLDTYMIIEGKVPLKFPQTILEFMYCCITTDFIP